MRQEYILGKYIEDFSNLHTNKRLGVIAPHKPILLLSIIDLIERKIISDNKVYLTNDLERTFKYLWTKYVGKSVLFNPDISKPFWHLNNEPFWHLKGIGRDGYEWLVSSKSPYSVKSLGKFCYAELDRDLYDLLQNESIRAHLRVILISKYLNSTYFSKTNIIKSVLPLSIGILMHVA